MKRITIISLFIFVLGTVAALVINPKQDYSVAERRRLADKPVFSLEGVLDGSFGEDFEAYLLDHFPFRETFRSLKAHFACDVLMQKENNGIYIADGHASKLAYPLNETGVNRAVEKVLLLKERYFPNSRVFYTVIPDKNYFLAEKNGYPHMDYERLFALLDIGLSGEIQYIDILPALTIDSYYKTDTHWRQECIGDVVELLYIGLGSEKTRFDRNAYQQNKIENFYGVYCGQAALPFSAEEIVYLTNEEINHAEVYDVESNDIKEVYQTQIRSNGKSFDAYDVYLGGARAVLTIKNTLFNGADEGKKRLIVFRDSFASSLAPLLLEQYSEIVLIDLRYISTGLLDKYVDFTDADILFAYNTLIWNQGSLLK